jgi:hypothetical protein
MKDELKLPPPKEAAVGRCLPRRAEARRGAANASCRMYCRESSRAISWPTKPGNGKQLDHLVLVPNGKLVTLRFHLEEDARSSHLRTEVVGGQIDIDAAIPTHMTQLHLLIQRDQPGIRVNPQMPRAGSGGKVGNATRGGTFPQERRLLGTFVVVVLEKRLGHLAYPLLACSADGLVSTPVRRCGDTVRHRHSFEVDVGGTRGA